MSAKIDDSFPTLENNSAVPFSRQWICSSWCGCCKQTITAVVQMTVNEVMTRHPAVRDDDAHVWQETTNKKKDEWGKRKSIWMNETFSFALRCAYPIRTIRRIRTDRRIRKRLVIDGRYFHEDFCPRSSKLKSTSNKRVSSYRTFLRMFLRSESVVTMLSFRDMQKHNDLVTITRSLMCWFEMTITRMSTTLLEQPISHEEVGDEDLSTAATLSWNYVQEDERRRHWYRDVFQDPEIAQGLLKLGRVKIKSLISCRDATGAVWRRWRTYQLTEDTQQEECWHKTDGRWRCRRDWQDVLQSRQILTLCSGQSHWED